MLPFLILVSQVHAFNTIKAVLQDTAVGVEMHAAVEEAFLLSVQGFSSESWAVRNGALLLFGVLLARMLGGKRVRDEHSRVNSITAVDFFSRWVRERKKRRESLVLHERGKVSIRALFRTYFTHSNSF